MEGQGSGVLDARVSLDPGFLIARFANTAEVQRRVAEGFEALQSDIAYRGLCVRMVISTGTAEGVKYHRLARRMEYGGQVNKVSETGHRSFDISPHKDFARSPLV